MEDFVPGHVHQAGVDEGQDAHRGDGQDGPEHLHQEVVCSHRAVEQESPAVSGQVAGRQGREDGDEYDVEDVSLGEGVEKVAREQVLNEAVRTEFGAPGGVDEFRGRLVGG